MTLNLKDPTLLRQQCYVDGQWLDARSGGTQAGHEPGDGCSARHGAIHGCRRNARRDRGSRGRLPRLGCTHGQGPLHAAAPLARPDARQRGRPRHADDRRAGQAARRGQRRDHLRGLVHRVVRGRSQARLRRRDPGPPARQAHLRAAPARRRRRSDYAVEFPGGDDHAQGGPGARGGLHLRVQAGDADALLRARHGRTRASRRHSEGRVQRRSPARPRPSAAR